MSAANVITFSQYERAVRLRLHPPAADESVPEFSSDTCGSQVEDFIKTLKKIEDGQWKALLDACGSVKTADEINDEEYHANLSFMDRHRAALFDFPSPVKA